MKKYAEQLSAILENTETVNEGTVLRILYDYYLENDVSDTGEIAKGFAHLDVLLRELTLKNYDRIWDTAVRLCSDHERRGFDAGLRMGTNLAWELERMERRSGS